MKRFYLLRIVCLVAGFMLSAHGATIYPSWKISIMIASTATFLFGLIYELYSRYKTGEEQKVRGTCRELVELNIGFFVAGVTIR